MICEFLQKARIDNPLLRINRRQLLKLGAFSATEILLGAACQQKENPASDDLSSFKPSQLPPRQPTPSMESRIASFFPFDVGSQWTYEISIGETEPLYYHETTWQIDDNRGLTYATRGRFLPLLDSKERRFSLTFSVEDNASKQGPYAYPLGVSLKIDQDDLGVFKDSQKIFWAINTSEGLQIMQVVTYSSDTIGAPTGSWGMPLSRGGFSRRLIFFGGENEGIGIGLGNNPQEVLFYTGVENGNFHFVRKVKAGEKEKSAEGYIDKGFTEETWYQPLIGLKRLKQLIDGKTSMIWELKQFSKKINATKGTY